MIERLSTAGAVFDVLREAESDFQFNPQWWRGQARDWPLVAPVHRVTDRGPYEHGITTRFKARAGSRYPHVPLDHDSLGWLTLMQHYGLPTRLLDWSESPLVGLYFAVADPDFDGDDGVLWVLDPSHLNKHIFGGTPGTLQASAPGVGPLLDTQCVSKRAAALTPSQRDPRTLIQLACFTVHGDGTPLEGIAGDALLRKVHVDAAAKHTIRRSLRKVGITASYLFPDLEHLAEDERSRCFCLRKPCPHSGAESRRKETDGR